MPKAKKIQDSFNVYAALHEDISNCSAWIQHRGMESFNSRTIVAIRNPANRKTVHCELYKIDSNFRNHYKKSGNTRSIPLKDNVIILNYYYRAKLGIDETGTVHTLSIKKALPLIGNFRLNISHPQSVVRMAVWLGGISVIMGAVSLIASFWPLK